jgi:hypothetical protein
MTPTLTCLALAFVGGVDYGYRPWPKGGTEFIIQIDPATLQTLQPGDPFSLDLSPEARQARPSHFTITLGNEQLPRILPPPVAAAAPAAAPIVAASPLFKSPVVPATATAPLGSPSDPGATPATDQGPQRVAPPSGAPVAPRTTNEQSQGADDARAAAANPSSTVPGIEPLPPVNGSTGTSFDGYRLLLYLFVIGLVGLNGYIFWLFLDARQRYLRLLSQTFAAAK